MKKILYIFLAHVIVLGSLWIWKNTRDAESPVDQDRYCLGEAVVMKFSKTESRGLKILVCINEDEIEDALAGQGLSISMMARVHDKEMEPTGFQGKDSHTCYEIFLNRSDIECAVLSGDDGN